MQPESYNKQQASLQSLKFNPLPLCRRPCSEPEWGRSAEAASGARQTPALQGRVEGGQRAQQPLRRRRRQQRAGADVSRQQTADFLLHRVRIVSVKLLMGNPVYLGQ